MREPSAQEAQEFIAASGFIWHQRFELGPQVFTPGANDIGWLLHEADLPLVMDGMSVLDIGTTNGAMAFECERRGASRIVAVDILDPEHFGLTPLIRFLESKVEYVQASVYELADVLDEQFDFVGFWGVLYHLRHPLLGLDSVRRLSKGRMTLETAVCDHADGAVGPLARFHRLDDLGGDGTNWWSPSLEALHAWVASAGYSIRKSTPIPSAKDASRALLDLEVSGEKPEYLAVSYERPLRLQTIDLS